MVVIATLALVRVSSCIQLGHHDNCTLMEHSFTYIYMTTLLPQQTHTQIHTDRHKHTDTDTQTHKHTNIQTYRHTDTQTHREREREKEREKGRKHSFLL